MAEIEILWRDDDLLFVNKPAGLPSQSTHDKNRPNLLSVVEKQTGERLFLHHRLDKDTSGVMVLGRTSRVNKGLTDIFRDHKISKTYWALAKKIAPPGISKISSSGFLVDNFVAPVRGPKQKLMRMVQVKSGGWRAITEFRLIQELNFGLLVEAKPTTGRTHQIRIHLAGLKQPILGDTLYGGKSSEVPRLMLHAKELRLPHPITAREITVEAPLPKDFQTLISS
jgi:RluA family pseudouridine synthase